MLPVSSTLAPVSSTVAASSAVALRAIPEASLVGVTDGGTERLFAADVVLDGVGAAVALRAEVDVVARATAGGDSSTLFVAATEASGTAALLALAGSAADALFDAIAELQAAEKNVPHVQAAGGARGANLSVRGVAVSVLVLPLVDDADDVDENNEKASVAWPVIRDALGARANHNGPPLAEPAGGAGASPTANAAALHAQAVCKAAATAGDARALTAVGLERAVAMRSGVDDATGLAGRAHVVVVFTVRHESGVGGGRGFTSRLYVAALAAPAWVALGAASPVPAPLCAARVRAESAAAVRALHALRATITLMAEDDGGGSGSGSGSGSPNVPGSAELAATLRTRAAVDAAAAREPLLRVTADALARSACCLLILALPPSLTYARDADALTFLMAASALVQGGATTPLAAEVAAARAHKEAATRARSVLDAAARRLSHDAISAALTVAPHQYAAPWQPQPQPQPQPHHEYTAPPPATQHTAARPRKSLSMDARGPLPPPPPLGRTSRGRCRSERGGTGGGAHASRGARRPHCGESGCAHEAHSRPLCGSSGCGDTAGKPAAAAAADT